MKKLFLFAFLSVFGASALQAAYVQWGVTTVDTSSETLAGFGYAQLEFYVSDVASTTPFKTYLWDTGTEGTANAKWKTGITDPQAAYVAAIDTLVTEGATFVAIAYDAYGVRLASSDQVYTASAVSSTYLLDDQAGGVAQPSKPTMSFTFGAVPEPTSGLLLLLGASLLALRRREHQG